MTTLSFDGSFADWKRVARSALAAGTTPQDVDWVRHDDAQPTLPFLTAAKASRDETDRQRPVPVFRVPPRFLNLARHVSLHQDGGRWALLYRVLWRLTHGEPQLLEDPLDDAALTLARMEKEVKHAVHHMRAFVRFREVATVHGPWFVAWIQPPHAVLELNAEFFIGRFATMNWSILTPDRCMHWDREELWYTPGVPKSTAPALDATEDLWRTYYTSIFNPARVKIRTMVAHMPQKYWNDLPETAVIPRLLEEAPAREQQMIAASARRSGPPTEFGIAPVPVTDDWNQLRDAARTCRACPLWRDATCTVFGEGPRIARVMLVGEQPGDQEDRAGRAFVGPAGQLLDRALQAAGIDREHLYVTNAVKHFKWEPRGPRRIHQRPNSREIAACRPWLEAEIALIRPHLIVCLGATAAQAVFERPLKINEHRGRTHVTRFHTPALVTIHPSALLRLPDPSAAEQEYARFVDDLRLIANAHDGGLSPKRGSIRP